MSASNRLGIDYRAEAVSFNSALHLIDVHSHILGEQAALIYKEVQQLYGVRCTYSMTPLHDLPNVKRVLGDAIRFIAIPDFSDPNPREAFGKKFVSQLAEFHEHGARIVKFWSAPRGIDIGIKAGDSNLLRVNSPDRITAMEVARELGMIFMVHVSDPDTWFSTKYSDSSIYGTKAQQYEPFEELLSRFDNPWIAAHMGGWPEDLNFLRGILTRHQNLYLDSSATKWIVRELSKHTREDVLSFLTDFKGRILFGSDIVTSNAHLIKTEPTGSMADKASSESEAFDLYASRYWALRTLFETDYLDESPIADPDLAMVEPDKYTELDAPLLAGKKLPQDILEWLYFRAADALLGEHN